MLDSAALMAWRRRAQRAGSGTRRGPSRAVLSLAAFALCAAVVGGRGLNSESAAPRTPHATPSPCPAAATYSNALQYSNALRADVDGDGCDDELSFSDGVLSTGAVRMRLGSAGDHVAVGRWTCGAATVALLRPATGEVFRFDGWATTGRAVPALALGRVDGAVEIHARAGRRGECDDLVVTPRSGPPVIVPEQPVAG